MKKLLLAILLLCAVPAEAQIPGNAPSGALFANSSATARPGRWETPTAWLDRWCSSVAANFPIRGSGASWGCVTMSGDATMSALGAVTIANNAVTLAKLATQPANTVLTNATAGVAVPTAFLMPSCSTTASALLWTNGGGFFCNTGIVAGSVVTAGVTNAMLADMAQSTIKGRAVGSGTGVPVNLTAGQATDILQVMVGDAGAGGVKGLVPAPAAGDALKVLSGAGTYIATGGTGTVTSVTCNGIVITTTGACPEPFGIENCTLTTSVAANILTVALKDNGGADPTAASPCRIGYRNAASSAGSLTFNSQTSALSITTNATGATLGSASANAFRFWVVSFDNGGTNVLALYNAVSGGATPTSCEGIDESNSQTSSTAISGSATSAQVFYTPNGTTITNKALRVLGYIEWISTGVTTAGSYNTGPSIVQSMNMGIPLPCARIATRTITGAQSNTASTTFVASSLALAISPRSAANPIIIDVNAFGYTTISGASVNVAVYRGSSACTTLVASNYGGWAPSSAIIAGISMNLWDKPNSNASAPYTYCLKNGDTASTVSSPYTGGGIYNGGNSMTLTVIQG